MDARRSEFRPSLFIRTAPDGDTWEFTATAEGGCALLCGGHIVAVGDGTEAAVDRILEEFLVACGAGCAARFPATSRPPDDSTGSGINPRAA